MDFIDLKNIERKDSPIHYINEYHGTISFSTNNGTFEKRIEIVLEKTALGATNIQLIFDDELLKAHMEELEEFINEKNKSGFFN